MDEVNKVMRIQIHLKTMRGDPLFVPFEYQHIIQGIIYSTLKSDEYRRHLHNTNRYKYFNYGKLFMYNFKTNTDGFDVPSGHISFILCSPSKDFINQFMQGILHKDTIQFKDTPMKVSKIEVLEKPVLNKTQEYDTLSPILITHYNKNTGKRHDYNPSEQEFFEYLENNLVQKYNQYMKKAEYSIHDIHIYTKLRKVKGLRVQIKTKECSTYNRAYLMDIVVDAPLPLQYFLYDAGLGHKTSIGFGCVKPHQS